MNKITRYLNQLIVGTVFDNADILDIYATDRSALKIMPKFVAFPESTEDIRKLLKFFDQISQKNIPVQVTPRGTGMDEGGADLTTGLVLSTENLNKMLELDPRERLVRVQAGITLRELNTALAVSGLTIPIAGHENNTIGGLIAGAPIDENARKYGGIRRYVKRMEVVLPNGEVLQTSLLRKYALAKKVTEKTTEGRIYHRLVQLLKKQEQAVQEIKHIKKRNMVGYPQIGWMSYRDTLDLAALFYGSQGTLGVISEVILKAVPITTTQPSRVLATFKSIDQALEFARRVESLDPLSVNLYDLRIMEVAHKSGKNLDGIMRRQKNGYVVLVRFDERVNAAFKKVQALQRTLARTAKFIYESSRTRATLDEFESVLTTYLNSPHSKERVPILTDFYLPIDAVENFLEDISVLEQKTGLDLPLYGSTATSVYNIRPEFDLADPDFAKRATALLRAGAYIVERQGGSFAGGAPEGRLKAAAVNESLGEEERQIYEEIKQIFDKHNIMNPDVKLGANARHTLTHFRTGALARIMI